MVLREGGEGSIALGAICLHLRKSLERQWSGEVTRIHMIRTEASPGSRISVQAKEGSWK